MTKLRMMTIAIPTTLGTSLFWFAHNQPHSGWLRTNREWEQSFRWRGGWGRILRERKNVLGYIAKSGTRPLQSFAGFFLFRNNLTFRLIRFFFFFRSRIKLGGYHNDAVTLLPTFWIRPFFRLEVAFNGYQLTFFNTSKESSASFFLQASIPMKAET